MGGLLYRDFVSVYKIRKTNLAVAVLIFVLVYVVFRVAFPGYKYASLATSPDAAMNWIDAVAFMMLAMTPVLLLGLSGYAMNHIISQDEKNKVRAYIIGMPISKNTYIASKYVFMIIQCYVTLAISYVMGSFFLAYCVEDIQQVGSFLLAMLLPMVCFILFYMSFDIPLLILNGSNKARIIEYIVLAAVAIVLIGVTLFADLDSMGTSIESIINWFNNNSTLISIVEILMPVIVGVIYYLSYRITCRVAARREWV